MSDLP
jgi:hypothetical protein